MYPIPFSEIPQFSVSREQIPSRRHDKYSLADSSWQKASPTLQFERTRLRSVVMEASSLPILLHDLEVQWRKVRETKSRLSGRELMSWSMKTQECWSRSIIMLIFDYKRRLGYRLFTTRVDCQPRESRGNSSCEVLSRSCWTIETGGESVCLMGSKYRGQASVQSVKCRGDSNIPKQLASLTTSND